VEFRSKLEDLMPAEELIFEPTPGFGPYKRFLEHAIAHPAKMNTKLLKFLTIFRLALLLWTATCFRLFMPAYEREYGQNV